MNRSFLPYLAAALAVLFWSHAFVSIKYCLDYGVTPFELVILRHIPAALVFFVYLAVTGKIRLLKDMLLASPGAVIIGAMTTVAAYHFPLNWGAARIPAGITSLIVGMGPVFAFLLALTFLKERSKWFRFAGTIVAFSGLYVCVRFGSGKALDLQSAYWMGILGTLLAAAMAGTNIVSIRYLSERYGAVPTTSTLVIIGTLPLLPLVSGDLVQKLPGLPWDFWVVDLFLGLGCTATAYLVWAYGLSKVEASRLSAAIYVVPVLGFVWAWVYRDEAITLWIVLGAAMVMAGVILTNWRGRREKKTRPEQQETEPRRGVVEV